MINFNHYVKPHDNGNGSGGVTYINGGVNNADLPADLTVTSINADKGDIKRLTGTSLTYNNGGFVYIAADDGTIKKLRGGEASELNYDIAALGEVHSGTINNDGKITTADLESLKAYIDSLQSHDITTEYLTVTKQAHFFELIIDKIKSTNGAIMVTQANCSLDYVKAFNSDNREVALDANNVAYYWAYWEATDKNGKSISNDWWPYDQAICMSFNDVQVGVNYNVQSKYYWRLVEDKTAAPIYLNINTGEQAIAGPQGTKTDRNTIHFYNPTLRYTIDESGTPTSYNLMNGWYTYVQKLNDDPTENERLTGCTWTQTSGGIGEVTQGIITTKNTLWGIQLEPILERSISGTTIAYDNPLASYIPDKFSFTTEENCRLNIGVYYTDGNSQYFPAPEKGQAKKLYQVDLVTTAPIEAIVITNADDVAWHLMNGIKLSNTDYDGVNNHSGDSLYANKSSIPSIGDNVVQLGYRYNHYSQSDPEYDVARASAIIISAYKTPDQGGLDPWGSLIDPIKPPSYAQYKNITDYSLASHRHTYFDADNASFIGSFYTSTHEEVGEKGPQGDPGPQGPRGFQGGTIKNAYANWPSGTQGPQMPADGTTVEQLNADTTQPWRSTSTTPDFANGYFTWMCENEIDGNGNYGAWRGLTRITGDNGKDGEDGDSTEFIYKVFAGPQSFGDDNNNPAYWDAAQTTDDYVGPSSGGQGAGYNWYDHPQGVQSDMPYEYVAQRKKYIPSGGTQSVWGQFGSPSLWSKYGQNGRDGDGVEYIFKRFAGPQTFEDDDYNPAYWDADQNDEYYGPSDGPQGYEYNWYDDPQGVQSDMPYEYVAKRKKIVPNGGTQAVWGKYGDPALWANWGTQGPQGNTGAQGANGRDGQTYTLIDQGSQAYMSSFLNETTGEITTQFTLDLSYKVDMLVGSEAHLMTVQETENQECDPDWPNTSTPFYAYVAWYKPGTGNGLYYWKMGKLSNYSDIQNFTYSQRYSNDSDTTTAIERNNSVIVALVRTPIQNDGSQYNMPDHFSTNNTTFLSCVIDSVSLPITMENTASMAIVKGQQGHQAAIKTLVIGQQGLQTNFSNMTQTMNGIQTNVVQLQGDISGVQSQLTQTASSLTSTISEVARTAGTWRCMKQIDLSTYNTSKCYPVGIILPQNSEAYGNDTSAAPVRIKVEAPFGLNSVSWSNHGNDGNFSFSCMWTTLGGQWGEYWGAGNNGWKQNELNNETSTDTYRKIESFESKFVDGNVAGSIRQCNPTSEELIFLRGGAKYNIYTSWYIAEQNLNATDTESGYIKAYPSGFSWSYPESSPTYYKIANAIDQDDIDVPIVDVRKYTEIEQTIDSISLSVFDAQAGAQGWVNEGQLQRTGIDITNGTINLQGNNVTFSNSAGTQSGLIYIDPTYGTLHATNADINGVLNANLFYSTVRILDSTNDEYVTLNPTNNEAANTYVCYSDITYELHITLPDARTYKGLEYNFFIYISSRNWAPTHFIYSDGIVYTDVSDPNNILSTSATSVVSLRSSSNYITLKALNGNRGYQWYVINGEVEAE